MQMPINRNKQGTAQYPDTLFAGRYLVWNIRLLHLQHKGTLGNKPALAIFSMM